MSEELPKLKDDTGCGVVFGVVLVFVILSALLYCKVRWFFALHPDAPWWTFFFHD